MYFHQPEGTETFVFGVNLNFQGTTGHSGDLAFRAAQRASVGAWGCEELVWELWSYALCWSRAWTQGPLKTSGVHLQQEQWTDRYL